MKSKILHIIFLITLPLYVIMMVYYTLLLYGFSGWGMFVSFTLTVLPTVAGIYFGLSLEYMRIIKQLKKQKDESN